MKANVPFSDTVLRLRAAITPLHPRGRKWLQFLHSLELDPDQLPRPLPAPGPRDFIICGAPRSGTTLLSAMLFQTPKVVTVMEPWLGMRLPPRELFASIRNEIDSTGRLSFGKLDVAELQRSGVVRWVEEGSAAPEVETEADYLLGVKWPAYWRYIDLLPVTKFLVCIRHPVEVIASFKHTGGRLALGLGYDLAFDRLVNRDLLSSTRNIALRRVLLYETIYKHLLPHLESENVLPVRYERWFDDPERLMDEISSFLEFDLGPMPARIRPPKNRPRLHESEMRLIVEHCRTAESLGYYI